MICENCKYVQPDFPATNGQEFAKKTVERLWVSISCPRCFWKQEHPKSMRSRICSDVSRRVKKVE